MSPLQEFHIMYLRFWHIQNCAPEINFVFESVEVLKGTLCWKFHLPQEDDGSIHFSRVGDTPRFVRITRHYVISWAFRLFKAAINVRRNPERGWMYSSILTLSSRPFSLTFLCTENAHRWIVNRPSAVSSLVHRTEG